MNRAKTITHPQTDSARWENEVFQPMRPNQLDPSLTNLARSILSQAFRDLLANQDFKQESEFWRAVGAKRRMRPLKSPTAILTPPPAGRCRT